MSFDNNNNNAKKELTEEEKHKRKEKSNATKNKKSSPEYLALEKELAENDLELVSCKKVKNNFDRGYEVAVKDSNTRYTYESTQYIEGQQGISRSTLDYLQAAVVDMSIDIEADREAEKQKSHEQGR